MPVKKTLENDVSWAGGYRGVFQERGQIAGFAIEAHDEGQAIADDDGGARDVEKLAELVAIAECVFTRSIASVDWADRLLQIVMWDSDNVCGKKAL